MTTAVVIPLNEDVGITSEELRNAGTLMQIGRERDGRTELLYEVTDPPAFSAGVHNLGLCVRSPR